MNLSFPCLKRDMDRVKQIWIHRKKIYVQADLNRFGMDKTCRRAGS